MELNYKRIGSGASLVILHGLFGSLDNWQTLAKQWAAYFDVITVDLRNHGKSPHSDEFTLDAMAQDVIDLLDNLNIESCYLLGHSMGGKVSMQLAFSFPERVKKLIIADIGPKAYQPGHHVIFNALRHIRVDELESRQDASAQISAHIKEPGVQQFLLKNLTRTANGYRWKMNLPIIEANYKEIIRLVEPAWVFTTPTLFIAGGASNYIEEADIDNINDLFSNALFEVIEGAGHWLHAEKPTQFSTLVLDFLN